MRGGEKAYNKVALLPALHFYAVDGGSPADRGAVDTAETAIKEDIQDCAFSAACTANDVT